MNQVKRGPNSWIILLHDQQQLGWIPMPFTLSADENFIRANFKTNEPYEIAS